MTQYHNNSRFLQFAGRRFDVPGRLLPSSAVILTAYDRSRDERDGALRALIDTQQRLRQALDIIHRQDCAIATLNGAPRLGNQAQREWIGYRLFWNHNCNFYYDQGFFSRATLRNTECIANEKKNDVSQTRRWTLCSRL